MPLNFYQLNKLLNEYGQSVVDMLIKKFMSENPGLNRGVVEAYIKDFEKIKNNLPNKDITTYSWKELESTVDGNRSKPKIKAGKIDPTVTDANLLYHQDNIRIYIGKDKKSCVRYSNGYTFCIGARGERNMYGNYRIARQGTPYFIFNDNLPQDNNEHLIVVFKFNINHIDDYLDSKFSVTLADNREEENFPDLASVVKDYPWVKPLTTFEKLDVDPSNQEKIEYYLKFEYENKKRSTAEKLDFSSPFLQYFPKHNSHLLKSLFTNKTKEFEDFVLGKRKITNANMFVVSETLSSSGVEYNTWGTVEGFLFHKDTNELVKELINQIEEVGFDEKSNIIQNLKKSIDKIEQILQNNKNYAPSFEEVFEVTDNIKNPGRDVRSAVVKMPNSLVLSITKDPDWTKLLICLGNPENIIKEEIKDNENVRKLFEIEKEYQKQSNWVRNASEQDLKKVMDRKPRLIFDRERTAIRVVSEIINMLMNQRT